MRKIIPIIIILALLLPLPCLSAISTPYTNTFNCDEYTEPEAGTWEAGGECGDLGFASHHDYGFTRVVTAANYSGGAGGNGLRMVVYDGSNTNSSAMAWYYSSGLTEFWIRFYMRYQNGFTWSGDAGPTYHKILYNYTGTMSANGGFEWDNSYSGYTDLIQAWSNSAGVAYPSASNNGFLNLFGGDTSDGSWHCYEAHFKMDTNGSNGITQGWIDGVQKFNYTNANFGTIAGGWTSTGISINQSSPSNAGTIGSPAYIDFDDFAFSTTGYIGTLEEDETAPIPSNLLPSGNTTYATTKSLTLNTNESSNCRYHATSTTWAEMSAMSTTGGTSHAQTVNVSVGANSFKVVCQDASENESSAGTWSFTVAAEAASAKTITIGSGSQTISGGGTNTIIFQ